MEALTRVPLGMWIALAAMWTVLIGCVAFMAGVLLGEKWQRRDDAVVLSMRPRHIRSRGIA